MVPKPDANPKNGTETDPNPIFGYFCMQKPKTRPFLYTRSRPVPDPYLTRTQLLLPDYITNLKCQELHNIGWILNDENHELLEMGKMENGNQNEHLV